MLGQLKTLFSAPYSGRHHNGRHQQVCGLRCWYLIPERNQLGMSDTQLSPGGRYAIGAACCLLGVGLLGVSATIFLQNSASGWSSDAIPGAGAGAVFAFGGAVMLTPPGRGRLRLVLAALLVTSWALATDWIAFGPGVRQFTTSISRSGSVSFPVDPWQGRIMFGIVAVLLDLFAGGLWYVLVRRWRRT
jgi:hypothetical protein